jgi:SAM-dependent methyltransferase
VPLDSPPWIAFTYPLNVFMLILTSEEGTVRYLHYGLFENADDTLLDAQERSTELLLSRLPPPPARVLEVGIGLGTTLGRLLRLGYEAEGITPDEHQIAMAGSLPVHCAAFESYDTARTYDIVVFQESAQYIDSEALFARATTLTSRVLVVDEFSLQPVDGLRSRDAFLAAAARHGFAVHEELDLSASAAPTMDYFTDRIPAFRDRLIADLGLTGRQIDELIESGARYRARYADGTYGYRLFDLRQA